MKQTDDDTVTAGSRTRLHISRTLDRQLWKLQNSAIKTWRSPARFASLSADEINNSGADIVNLHWVTDGLLSIEELGRVRLPIVWSMYDMWPFAGAEHYGISDSPRWRQGYSGRNRPSGDVGWDLDQWTFRRKVRHWATIRASTTLVPASRWLEESVAKSDLMHDWSVSRIPHVVNSNFFEAIESAAPRDYLDIHPETPLVLFMASAGINDHRKGWDLLDSALDEVAVTHPNIHALLVGPIPDRVSQESISSRSRATIVWHEPTDSDEQLRSLLSAADVVVVPSREDNMPLSAMEAQTCGRPVVGFEVGGLPDIVEHLETGYIARPFDTADLARGITQALATSGWNLWGSKARSRAISTWSGPVIARQYADLYARVIKKSA